MSTSLSSSRVDRSSREFDIIVYGATGFTGVFVCKYIQSLILSNSAPADTKWAIAGRSESKLGALIQELQIAATGTDGGKKNSNNSANEDSLKAPSSSGRVASDASGDIASLPSLLVADASSHEDLVNVCLQGKLLLNCTGPYRFLGESVVKACLDAKTDYMDICGEPQFMEKMFLDHNNKAEEADTLIISACAFDSVPADLGCLFTQKQFPDNCCSSIESFLRLNCGPEGLGGHFTTFECAVHGISDSQTLKDIRKGINTKYDPPVLESPGPKLQRVSTYFWDDRVSSYAIPFMGADASVVRNTSRSISMKDRKDGILVGKKVPQYAAYMCVNNWINLSLTAVWGLAVSTLAGWSWGRSLVLAYPGISTLGIFSHEGPTTKQLETTSFEMHFYGKGFSNPSDLTSDNSCSGSSAQGVIGGIKPNKEVHVVISGPEPGYVATPRIFVTLAMILLQDRRSIVASKSKMPHGGVMTPGAAFHACDGVVDKLCQAGVNFTVL